jgi:hypothetical protein
MQIGSLVHMALFDESEAFRDQKEQVCYLTMILSNTFEVGMNHLAGMPVAFSR